LDIQGVSKQREQKCDSPEIFLRCVKGGPLRSIGSRWRVVGGEVGGNGGDGRLQRLVGHDEGIRF